VATPKYKGLSLPLLLGKTCRCQLKTMARVVAAIYINLPVALIFGIIARKKKSFISTISVNGTLLFRNSFSYRHLENIVKIVKVCNGNPASEVCCNG